MNRQEELEALNDEGLNHLVYCLRRKVGMHLLDAKTAFGLYDYCNCPADIMPIAFESKFELTPMEEKGEDVYIVSYADDYNITYEIDKNPYRAICIVFILMKEAENEVAS